MGIGLLLSTFGAGMLATINPCGFAMLPAYISYFLNLDNAGTKRDGGSAPLAAAGVPGPVALVAPRAELVVRAVQVGAITTAGFLVLFVTAGTLISLGARFIIGAVPWIGLVIGAALFLMGIWVVTGHHLTIPGLSTFRVERRRTLGGFFLYGIAYGLASLTCTLPIFLAVIGTVFLNGLALQGVGQFVAYSLGMGLVIVALTISLAFFKGALVKRIRRIIPYVERISAVLLIGAGGYLVYYWLFAGRLISRFV